MGWLNLYSVFGCLAIVGLAWVTSSNRRAISWNTVLSGIVSMASVAGVIFWFPPFRSILVTCNSTINLFLAASREGIQFLFGPLSLSPGEPNSLGPIIAFQVLPTIIFFSVITALFYYIGFLPWVVHNTARLVRQGFKLSGAEAVATASNLFVGIESVLMIRPFIKGMTKSELMMILTAGLSTIASTVLAFYVSLLKDVFPYIAGHLISASVISIPAAIIIAKILVPETQKPLSMEKIPPMESYMDARHWMSSIIWGANEGVRLAFGIGALLIGMLGLVAIIDLILSGTSSWVTGQFIGQEFRWTVKIVLQWLAYPLVLCLGLSPGEWSEAAKLLGERWILTEVIAFQDLRHLVSDQSISPRGLLILSYSLCGFTHIASMAIFVGGISTIEPSRREDIVALSWRALWGASLATTLTGSIAGTFYYGQSGLLF